jgi:uncharacterized membrane protein YbaN (DUF454 family)
MQAFLRRHLSIKKIGVGLILLGVSIILSDRLYARIPAADKNTFIVCYIIGVCSGVAIFYSLKNKLFKPSNDTSNPSYARKGEHHSAIPASKNYQQLIEEVQSCNAQLRKYKWWTIGCLLAALVVVLTGKLSGHAQYSHPMFASSIFLLAFIVGTKNLEKETELDTRIVNCTLEGKRIKSTYFLELARSFEGWGLITFVFVRISPALWILFSVINTGILQILATHLPASTAWWVPHAGAGLFLGLAGIFLARMATQPYSLLKTARTS